MRRFQHNAAAGAVTVDRFQLVAAELAEEVEAREFHRAMVVFRRQKALGLLAHTQNSVQQKRERRKARAEHTARVPWELETPSWRGLAPAASARGVPRAGTAIRRATARGGGEQQSAKTCNVGYVCDIALQPGRGQPAPACLG